MEDSGEQLRPPGPDGAPESVEGADLFEPLSPPEPSPTATAFILKSSVLSAVVRLTWPLWVAMALQDAYSLVDLFWVGKLGKEAVAALALCGMLMGFVFVIAIGISTGVVAMVSRFVGQGRREEAGIIAWQALFMGLAAGGVATAVGLPFAEPALVLLGAKGAVVGLGTGYLQIMAVGAVGIFVTFAMNAALRGAGDTLTPMVAMILGTVINLVLDPLLIFGWAGFPALGVKGSALATVIAQSAGMLWVLFRLFQGRRPVRLNLLHARLNFPLGWRVVRIGAFGSIQMWVRNISSLIVVAVAALFGDAVLAAFAIGMRLLMVVLLPGFGVGNAASTVVGQNLGAGNRGRAVRAGWIATSFYLGIVTLFALVFSSLAHPIVRLFNADPEVVEAGAALLRFLSLSFPFMAFGLILSRAMAGAGDTFSPMWITALCLLGIQAPGAYLLSRFMGHDGIWISIATANAFNGLITAVWYARGRWTEKRV
ncbi:MAG: MATE family efflux transporter [Planctomycetota bacterium]